MHNTKKFSDIALPAILILSLLVCSYKAIEIRKKEKTCLVLSGQVVKTTVNTSPVKVMLIEENHAIDSLTIAPGETFRFNLKEDRYYAVRVTQEKMIPRLVSISTWMPRDLREVKVYRFHFDLYQLQQEEKPAEAEDVLDFPIALIRYDETKGYFDYNSFYTTHIKNTYQKLKAAASNNFIITSL